MQEEEAVAQELLSKEIIFKADMERLIGNRPFEEHKMHEDLTAPLEEMEAAVEKPHTTEKSEPEVESPQEEEVKD